MGDIERTTEGYECYACGKIAPKCGCIPIDRLKLQFNGVSIKFGPLRQLTDTEDRKALLLAVEIIEELQAEIPSVAINALFIALGAYKEVYKEGPYEDPPT